jgi:DNA-binding NtrC family response regulator
MMRTSASPLIGKHPSLQEVLAQAERLATVDRPVLILGERGTGKELIARHLHMQGARRQKPFVTVNCGAFGGELLRSEIFGHEKGAFTGADQRRAGRLEQADGGTLLLDEIGNMSMPFQEQVLRVIEYQTFERTGGNETLHVDVRVIAATNADMDELIREEEFRADLYDRLSFAVLRVPPLRERRSDIPLLVQHFAQDLAAEMPAMEYRPFSTAAMDALMQYYWPGNIRQLRNVIERVYILGDGVAAQIEPRELPPEVTGTEPVGETFDEQVESFQRSLINGALRETGNNQKEAASRLGLTYDRFRHYYRKLEIRDRVEP